MAREIRVSRLIHDPDDYDNGDPPYPLGWWRTHDEAVRASGIAGEPVVVEDVAAVEMDDGAVNVEGRAIRFGFANRD